MPVASSPITSFPAAGVMAVICVVIMSSVGSSSASAPLTFEIIAVLLLVAVIGAVVIAKRRFE